MRAASALFAAIVFAAATASAATTTNILLCATSNDATAAAANQAASGWTFSAPGAETQAKEGSYYYPVKFNSGTTATSASVASGSYMTALVLGVKVSNVARTVTVTPYDAAGTIGTPQTIAPGAAGSLVDVSFSFTASEAVSYVTVGIAGSGSATAYLYYATVTTETSGGGGVNTPPAATQPSVDVDATVGTEATVDLSLYFTDADGDQLTFALDSGVGAVNGSVWSFTPTAAGSFSADVTATDPSGDSAVTTISVTAVLPPLAAPLFEPAYPEDATADGFVVRWTAVENAVGYDLVVTNVADRMETGFQVSYSGPNYPDNLLVTATVTGLDADTLYAVAVRALATTDPAFPSTDYSDSDWSAPVEIATTLEGGLRRATLFDETFDHVGGTGWNNSGALRNTDETGWTTAGNVYRAPAGLRLGTSDKTGCATTREIVVSNDIENAAVVISFLAASYTGASTEGTLTLSNTVTDANTILLNLTPDSMSNGANKPLAEGTFYEFEATVPARFALCFESLSTAPDKRLLLDSIKVTQVYDPNYAVLPAPTGVQASNVGNIFFTVSWNPVEHATGYEVWLADEVAGSCTAASTSMELDNLTPGEEYEVRVRALGDNLHVGDSPRSASIWVTTLEDAQKVDFTVTGAPAGDVFAGDTVAFSVTAQIAVTGVAAPISFAGIDGATFSNGTFSWTPTESDVGDNVANFASGAYSTNVTIKVVSAFETKTLETENFSKISSSSWTSTTGYATEMAGDIGTWTGTDIIKTKSAVIIGRRTSSGTIVSPAVELKARTPGSFSVSFDTGSVPGAKASVRAQILDAADGTVLYTTNFATVAALPADATAVSDAGARFTVAPGPSVVLPAAVKVAFTTYTSAGDDSQRAYVDTVVFQQTISARIRDLPAPTGLALVGEPGESGFTFGWTAVADATNYAVRVTDAGGAVVFSAPFCAATQAAVSGLSDDEPYTAQVRATGDESLWYASPWSDALAVRTARSAEHPTLSFGAWQNAVGDGKVYGGLLNTAAVSAVRDNGSNAVVTLASVLPAPAAGPALEGGVLSWIPADADTNKTFTVSFLMDGTYATNLSFKVFSAAQLEPPTVTAGPVAWDSFGLSWNTQYRAAGYGVRVWTDCPNPGATATRMEETFANWPKSKPAGWSYHNMASGYKDAAAPVSFDATGDAMTTYDLGGEISSVSFHAAGHSISNSTSTLTVVGIAADNTETVLGTLGAADIGQTAAGIDRTYSVPAGSDIRRIAWRYTKDKGGVGVGSVVVEGTGFSTPRWLPGWGPTAKDVGLVPGCTVEKPRPGKALGVDPSDPRKDLTEPRVNYAEVTVRDAAGAALSATVAVDVPAPPRSVRATLMILK